MLGDVITKSRLRTEAGERAFVRGVTYFGAGAVADLASSRKDNRAYDQAAALVAKVRDLMRRTGQDNEFAAWLDAVRTRHKAKQNFMQRLNKIR